MGLNSPVNMMLPQEVKTPVVPDSEMYTESSTLGFEEDKRKAGPDELSAPRGKKRPASDASKEDKTPLEGSSAICGHFDEVPTFPEDEETFSLGCETTADDDLSEDETPLEGSSAICGHFDEVPTFPEDEETFLLVCETTADDDLSDLHEAVAHIRARGCPINPERFETIEGLHHSFVASALSRAQKNNEVCGKLRMRFRIHKKGGSIGLAYYNVIR